MSAKETAPLPLRGFAPKRTTSFQQHQKRIEQLLAEGMYGGKAWKDEAFARYSELEDAEAEPGTISEITFSKGGTTGATVIAQAVECRAPAPQPAGEHVCQTPDYTDGPCYACAKDMLMEWVFERYENCVRISDEKTGEDRAEWLKDADHFMLILDLLRGAATPQVTPHFPDCNVGTSHECCVARMKRLEKEQYGHARESRRTPGKVGKVERD